VGSYKVVRAPVNTFIAFTMNPTKDPWKDDRIRQAANYALDRQQFIDLVYKGEAQENGILHWPLGDIALSGDELHKYQSYDPKKARDLIKAATGQDTVKIKVMYPAESAIEEHNLHLPIWLEQMRAAGFEVEEDPQAFGTWRTTTQPEVAGLALSQVYEYANSTSMAAPKASAEQDLRGRPRRAGRRSTPPSTRSEGGRRSSRRRSGPAEDLRKGPTFLPIVSRTRSPVPSRVKDIGGNRRVGLFRNDWWLES
jgi:ABC-type transport system substrate-binding protein